MGGHSSGGLFPGTSGGKDALIAEARARGLNISPDRVVGITMAPGGKIVWLETGRSGKGGAGLAHIVERHGSEFGARGISTSEIPGYLIQAVSTGSVVGMQGSRPIYEFAYNGVRHHVAITVSSNGYIVGANLKPLPKEK